MKIADATPVEVRPFDIVGYTRDEKFILLLQSDKTERALPCTGQKPSLAPELYPCVIRNNQIIRFADGEIATLHDINGHWHYMWHKASARPKLLEPHCFFELGPW